jgi:hypothetical protein
MWHFQKNNLGEIMTMFHLLYCIGVLCSHLFPMIFNNKEEGWVGVYYGVPYVIPCYGNALITIAINYDWVFFS